MALYLVSHGEHSDYTIESLMVGPDGQSLHNLLLEFKQETAYPGDHGYLERSVWFEAHGANRFAHTMAGIFTDWLVAKRGFEYVTFEELNID